MKEIERERAKRKEGMKGNFSLSFSVSISHMSMEWNRIECKGKGKNNYQELLFFE